MACCRTMLRSFLSHPNANSLPPSSCFSSISFSSSTTSFGHVYRIRVRNHHRRFGGLSSLNCSNGETPSSSSSAANDEQSPPQEAVLKVISEVSKTEGRVGQTTNVVIGGTVTDDSTNEWIALDQKVNSYPTVRGFTAIGIGGDDFVQAMVVAVESVVEQPIPEDCVKHKVSSGGKYVSVNIGPIHVVSSEQVQAIYSAMRRDNRMKYFL